MAAFGFAIVRALRSENDTLVLAILGHDSCQNPSTSAPRFGPLGATRARHPGTLMGQPVRESDMSVQPSCPGRPLSYFDAVNVVKMVSRA